MTLFLTIAEWVRRILKTPDNTDLSNDTILEYFNRFYRYHMPARIQLFSLHSEFSFLTQKNIDKYNAPIMEYQNFMGPFYVDGRQIYNEVNPGAFFSLYPNQNDNEEGAEGDGSTGPYTFTITSTPIIRAHETVSGDLVGGVFVSTETGSQEVRDDGNGVLTGDGSGQIDYESGDVSVTFSSAVPTSEKIYYNSVSNTTGAPITILFYENYFTLRPIPDKPYLVKCLAYKTPSAFANTAASLEFEWMAEYLARGTARLIMSDFGDSEQIKFYEPFFKEQEAQVLRRTYRQNVNQRVSTIYTSPRAGTSAPWGRNGGGR